MAEEKNSDAVIALVCILLGIAIPIIVFWVLIIWCSRRKRKRMAEFHKTPELPTPVGEDVEAAEPKEPKEEDPEAKGGKSSKSAAKSAKSGKSAKDEGTGTDAGGKTGDGKTGE